MSDVTVYASGLCYTSVCAPKSMTPADVEAEVNATNPTGISSRWAVASESFESGEPNPCQCADDADRIHYMLSC